jgi:tripartite-type tricarboxylate transporter receptor subunit TctC
MLSRRALFAGLAAPALARAQTPGWEPTRPVTCVIGFAPGGGSDLIARAIIEATQPLVPQPLVVSNRAGAGGTIAAQQVALAAPDGHTLMLGGGSESTAIPAFRTLPYDTRRAFRAVMRVMRQRMFILSRADGPYRSMDAAIAAARVKPQAVSHGSSGIGSLYHAVFLVLEKKAGVEFLHVPYTGGAPGLQAVAAGQVDLMVAAPEEFQGLVQGGLLRVLACCSADRAPLYPDVPTLKECGFDMALENMKGWLAPAATPDPAILYWQQRFRAGMQRPSWQAFEARAGESDGYLDGPAFQAAIEAVLDTVTAAAVKG